MIVHDTTAATTSCPPCQIHPFQRNHYFTGKLLVERDFTDEQRYYIDKLRHHHQRLHGWGVVCGMKVKQHPNTNCRPQFVVIEPGTAIDCCGRELLIEQEELVDLWQFAEVQKLKDEQPPTDHELQIRVCYRECPTEDIPVLYDECGCDDTRCAPNRILESFQVEVVVDPPKKAVMAHDARLRWETTIGIGKALQTALDDAGHRIYVLTGGDNPSIVKFSTENHAVKACRHLDAPGRGIALAPNGDFLYAVTENPVAGQPHRISVLAASDLQPNVAATDVTNSTGRDVFLATTTAHADRLYILLASAAESRLQIWQHDAAAVPATFAMTKEIVVAGAQLRDLVVASGGALVYSLEPATNQIRVFNVLAVPTAAEAAPLAVLPAGGDPQCLDVVRSSGADMLVVAGGNPALIYLLAVDPAPALLPQTVTLDPNHKPIDIVAARGGGWAYVLLSDAAAGNGTSYVQPIDLNRIRQNLLTAPGAKTEVGRFSHELELASSGQELYVAFAGDPANECDGGVAVVSVAESDCCELLWRDLEGCPACDEECVVLATIENYRWNRAVVDFDTVTAAEVARINNRRGRHLLPSTQTLTDVLKCLCEHGLGGEGKQGEQGAPGLPGAPGLDGQPGADGLDGQPGADGKDGEGLEKDLTQIEGLSWVHNQPSQLATIVMGVDGNGNEILERGVVISFTRRVQVNHIDADHVFQILVEHMARENNRLGFRCRCPVVGRIVPVKPRHPPGTPLITVADRTVSPSTAVAFLFDRETEVGKEILSGRILELWVRLRGDFVIDIQKRAVDAEFVRFSLPTGDRPAGSPFGVQGGLFESWFVLSRIGFLGTPVRINTASLDQLITLHGVGRALAQRIIEFRATTRINSAEDLRNIRGIGDQIIRENSGRISFE
jgi:hypothetical protein